MAKINNPLALIISKVLNEKLKAKVKKFFWPYRCYIYFIEGPSDYNIITARIKLNIVPITLENYQRVADYREDARIAEYREKLMHDEMGIFAEHEGKMVGSYWASINKTEAPRVVKTFFKLMPGEALLHDVFVNPRFRGNRIDPQMVSYMCTMLLKEYGLKRLITDVNVKNDKSLHSAKTLGWRIRKEMLFIAIFGKPVLRLVLKNYV